MTHPNSLKNLRPWKPGESGNLSGRPKGKTLEQLLHEKLNTTKADGQTYLEELRDLVLREALKGRPDVLALLVKRIYPEINQVQLDGDLGVGLHVEAARKRLQAKLKALERVHATIAVAPESEESLPQLQSVADPECAK